MPPYTVCSVNTGSARRLQAGGRRVLSAIGKQAVAGSVALRVLGLEGDEQADLRVHGGRDKAVYAYPAEHYGFWQARRQAMGASLFDKTLPPGFVGENLSLQGLLETDVWVGDSLHFPDCSLRVTEPRQPCFKFNAVMGYTDAARDMLQQGCCGFYLAVLRPGSIQAGQAFTLEPGPRALSIAAAFGGKRTPHLR
ncbi:MOSC domain-containing protein YiiM [Rhodoferax sp. OV413]|uniref:MOSC domain-containing protein n=1 Tax=Rhodoferax sp. OV413 TaxID=1855285 RepID=UPI00087F0F01|nr:MOSC domain-containing protein [Rhodoferax sp. OV413]SDP37201.1 MOSC domain-containing protein YiiM [Rhodoferax sp. OV413]